MSPKEILQLTAHRPWPMPAKSWQYYQEWNNAVFLHWPVKTNDLRKFVPERLEIDLFEGQAWISLVAFTMEQIRPKLLPAFPPISNFHEINIRTYVKAGGKTGVYFLSIEGGKALACFVAKTLSGLPYRYSKIDRTDSNYQSKNDVFSDRLSLEYEIKDSHIQKSALDKWLTERYSLFQETKNGNLYIFEIQHAEWEVNEVELKQLEVHYPRFHPFLDGEPKLAHYSKGVEVVAWDKEKVT